MWQWFYSFAYWRVLAGVAVVCLCCGEAYGVSIGFARYQPILDRRPFGALGAGGDAEADAASVTPVVPAGPSFADKLQLCALTLRGERVFVGFVDNNQEPSVPYFLYVGESGDGYEVVEAEYANERVKIRKGTEERWIQMGGTAAPGSSPGRASGGAPVVATGSRRRPIPVSRRSTPGLTREEYLRQRKEGLRPAPRSPRSVLNNAVNTPRDPEWEKQVRKYNLDLIRAGGELGPALPIQLTPEEDAQLVSEGALAPQE